MYEVKRNGRRGYRLFGDRDSIATTLPIAAERGQTDLSVSAPMSFYDRLQDVIAKRTVFLPVPLIPTGVATACALVLVGWLFATGTVSLNLGPTEALVTGKDMNLFGTAAGTEALDALPELQELESK